LINSGKISAAKITITTDLDIKNSNLIQANLLDITSTHRGLSNSGTIKSFGAANITIENDFSNEGGTIDIAKGLKLIAGGALLNDEGSKIISKGKISLDISGKITNKGLIEAADPITAVTKGILDNSGTIISATGASFDAYLGLINTGNITVSNAHLQLNFQNTRIDKFWRNLSRKNYHHDRSRYKK
jgi:adhesin HecA-like repeat protein